MRLGRKFFSQPSLRVAKDLLGKHIVRRMGNGFDKLIKDKILVGKIVETEAYPGPQDRASHAFGMKKTPRNRAEYLLGGHIYIYLVYGMYWQLNISTGRAGYPECVLIRALEPVIPISINPNVKIQMSNQIQNPKSKNLANGPGKLCRWLKLNKSFYGEDVTRSKRLWIEDPEPKQVLALGKIASGPRIGIDYAGPKWAKKPWRFYIKGNPCVSHK